MAWETAVQHAGGRRLAGGMAVHYVSATLPTDLSAGHDLASDPPAVLSSESSSLAPRDIEAAMRRAIDAAVAHRGATAPNPPVGCCVLDKNGAVLATEAHRRAGFAHAEAAAIAACRLAGTADRIHTVVVTLEPCDHHGRTPPCTEAILSTPASTVVFGARDPNRTVAGGGGRRLAAAGLDVHEMADLAGADAAALSGRCRDLVAPFGKRAATGRPWVTVKQALDASRSMIPPPGTKTFTSEPALRYAHGLRRRADAILTGSGTVLADDPGFDVRRVTDHPGRRRALAILDRRRRVPAAYLVAAQARGLDAFLADDLAGALDRLGADGALEVLVEAGPCVTASVAAAELWDEWVVIRKGEDAGADRAEIRGRDGGVIALALA